MKRGFEEETVGSLGCGRGSSGFEEGRLGLGKTTWGKLCLNQRSETEEFQEGRAFWAECSASGSPEA